MKSVLAVLGLALAAVFTFTAPAFPQAYPTRVVRIIVPHPAGGPGDVPPRGIAQALSQVFGQPFVVENRDGADGIIGAEACAKAAADGYTLMSTSNGVMVVNAVARKKLSYDPVRDFVPVVQTVVLYSMIMAIPSVPANSMQEVLALLKAKPESLTLGTYGTGINFAAMVGRYTKARLGAPFYQIPYKSASQALQAAVAGQVQVVGYALGQAATLVKAGKMKPLAINSDKRLPEFPNVPTIKETGIDVGFQSWFGFFAPAGTSKEIVHRLNAEIARLVADPQFKAKFLTSQGLEPDRATGASPEEFARYMAEDREEFVKLARIADIQPQ